MEDNQITSPEEKEYGFTVPGIVAMIPENLENALDVGCSGGGLGYYLKSQLNSSFDNDTVADFFTAQYHLLFRRDTVTGI